MSGKHRAEPAAAASGQRRRGLVAGLVALAVVGSGIGIAQLFRHEPPLAGSGPVVISPTPTPSPSKTPSSRPTPRPTTSRPSPSPTVAAVAKVELSVYNASRIQGLGERAAAKFRAAGWPIRRVVGLRANVSVTTVYYDPPQKAVAFYLLASFPAVQRALPRPSWLARTGSLIVVVTRDFPA